MHNIEWNKVNRIFAIGCSLTNYTWPMWADILSKECPDAKFYNYGRPGAGNLYIMIRLSELHNIFQFDENDLVLIMFSSHYREDKWIKGWQTYGNMFNQTYYDENYMSKYFDQNGSLLQSLACIDSTVKYLDTIKSQKIVLQMTTLDNNGEMGVPLSDDESFTNKIKDVYKQTIENLPKSFFELEFNNERWLGYECVWYDGKLTNDPHPTPLSSLNYMKKLGINLTEKSIDYALASEKKMRDGSKIFTRQEIADLFPELQVKLEGHLS